MEIHYLSGHVYVCIHVYRRGRAMFRLEPTLTNFVLNNYVVIYDTNTILYEKTTQKYLLQGAHRTKKRLLYQRVNMKGFNKEHNLLFTKSLIKSSQKNQINSVQITLNKYIVVISRSFIFIFERNLHPIQKFCYLYSMYQARTRLHLGLNLF